MIKCVTQYVVVCDNSFCDAIVKGVVDFHSDDRRKQFESKVRKLGWKIQESKNEVEAPKFICPDCLQFSSELEKISLSTGAISRSA